MRKNLGDKIIFLPQPVLIIGSYDEAGNANAMNAAWGGQTDTNLISIAMSSHKSTDNIAFSKAFTISFGTKKTEVICDYFGCVTGNKENKIEKSGVGIRKSEFVNAPIIEEFPLTLECELVSYQNEVLVGKVINVSVDEAYLDKDGTIDVDKLEIITFDCVSHTYRILGEVVGQAFKDGLKLK